MKITPTDMDNYPTCPLCLGPIRRPCNLSRKEPEPFTQIICGGCYALQMKLLRFQEFGWLS